MKEDFGVAGGLKIYTSFFKFRSQLSKIINFAIVNEAKTPFWIPEWLSTPIAEVNK
jgi:hypothetical protein